jgi:hypothetical protein
MSELIDKRLVDEAVDAYVDLAGGARFRLGRIRALGKRARGRLPVGLLGLSGRAGSRGARRARVRRTYDAAGVRGRIRLPARRGRRAVYEPDKPRMMEVTDPNRDLFSCMRGEHGVGCYVPRGSAG